MTARQALAIVMRDPSGPDATREVAELETIATAEHFSLLSGQVVVVESDAELAVLLATAPRDEGVVILVGTLAHVAVWLQEMRRHAEVWTLVPRRRWPRRAPLGPGCSVRESQRS